MLRGVGSETQWRGQRDTGRWRLRALVIASALLHVPFSPLGALIGLVGLIGPQSDKMDVADLNAVTAIPVDLVEDEAAGTATPESEPAPTAEPDTTAQEELLRDLLEDVEPMLMPDELDAGLEDAAEEELDAGLEDAGLEDAAADAPVDGGDDAAAAEVADGGTEAGADTVRDPVALSGSAAKVVDANAHVRLMLMADRVRKHPLGARVQELLRNTYQWQDFFGPGGIDPIKDVERILIAGPQLRDSSQVIAVLQHKVKPDRVRRAVDRLVRRDPGGGWLDAGAPAATAAADDAERVFALPSRNVVVVAPPSARDFVLSLKADTKIDDPPGDEVVNLHLDTPWRALRGLPFTVPKSIEWAWITVTPTPDGGAVGRVVALDESPQAARQSAAHMQRLLGPYVLLDFVEKVDFSASDRRILGEVVATENQLAFLLELALQQQKRYSQQLAQRRQRAARAAARASSDAGTTPSSASSGAGSASPAAAKPPVTPKAAASAER